MPRPTSPSFRQSRELLSPSSAEHAQDTGLRPFKLYFFSEATLHSLEGQQLRHCSLTDRRTDGFVLVEPDFLYSTET
jgi:hypothetical protein